MEESVLGVGSPRSDVSRQRTRVGSPLARASLSIEHLTRRLRHMGKGGAVLSVPGHRILDRCGTGFGSAIALLIALLERNRSELEESTRTKLRVFAGVTMGWLRGLEPPTSCSTVRGTPYRLFPPSTVTSANTPFPGTLQCSLSRPFPLIDTPTAPRTAPFAPPGYQPPCPYSGEIKTSLARS